MCELFEPDVKVYGDDFDFDEDNCTHCKHFDFWKKPDEWITWACKAKDTITVIKQGEKLWEKK